MKICQKTIAVILSLCLLLSALAVSAAAEETREPVQITIERVEATQLKSDDQETVLQLTMTIRAASDENGTPAAAFDTFDENAELTIYEGLYLNLFRMSERPEEELYQKAAIAKAKPVSYEAGVLTLDVFSTNGLAGAKMVAIGLKDYEDIAMFQFDLPEGLLKDSASGLISMGSEEGIVKQVTGLTVIPVQLPLTIATFLKGFITGNTTLVTSGIAATLFALPVVALITAVRLNRFYSIYNINVTREVFELAAVIVGFIGVGAVLAPLIILFIH